MEVKQPTTYEQQIIKLRARGCQISDDGECQKILQNVNYYRLTAYFLPFKKADDTYFDVTIERIYNIYEFDRKLRRILLTAIEEIEIKLRTRLAYYHSHEYGALGYKDSNNFNQKHKHELFENKIKAEISNNRNVLYVKHHLENYEGQFPIWVAVELFTFGMLSFFFADLKGVDRRSVAENDFAVNADVLQSWLACCTDIRNICAHYGRLYYRRFSKFPKTPERYRQLSNTVFDYICIIKYLFPDKQRWNSETLTALEALINEYDGVIKLNHIGFPTNWTDLLNSTEKLDTTNNLVSTQMTTKKR
ncbi:Abi family protein [Oscillospiraceae bacterium CM]|nr:Abi family protein [Oscillospiraceae bacterium CM]